MQAVEGEPSFTREITLFGSCSSSGEYPEAIELLASGAVDVSTLISAVAPLAEGQSWFDRLHRADEGLIEGNFSGTENDYEVFVYHRPPAARADQLVAYRRVGVNKRN